MNNKENKELRLSKGEIFACGEVVKTHIIGEYGIIEYIDSISRDKKTLFLPYVINSKDTMTPTPYPYSTLDKAIIGVIAYKYSEGNPHSNNTAELIGKMLEMGKR